MKTNIQINKAKAGNLFGAMLICGLLAISMTSCGGDDWFKNCKKRKPKPVDSTITRDSTGTKDSTGGRGTGTKDSTGGGGTGTKDSTGGGGTGTKDSTGGGGTGTKDSTGGGGTGTNDSTVWVKRKVANFYSHKRD